MLLRYTSCQILSGVNLSTFYAPLPLYHREELVSGSRYYNIHRKQRAREGRNSSRTDGSLVAWFMSTHDGHMGPFAINLTRRMRVATETKKNTTISFFRK